MVKSKDTSNTNNIVKAAVNLVADRVGFKKKKRTKANKTCRRKRKGKKRVKI